MQERKQGSLFGMTYFTRKEKQTNGSLSEKTLSLQKQKISYRETKVLERKIR